METFWKFHGAFPLVEFETSLWDLVSKGGQSTLCQLYNLQPFFLLGALQQWDICKSKLENILVEHSPLV